MIVFGDVSDRPRYFISFFFPLLGAIIWSELKLKKTDKKIFQWYILLFIKCDFFYIIDQLE